MSGIPYSTQVQVSSDKIFLYKVVDWWANKPIYTCDGMDLEFSIGWLQGIADRPILPSVSVMSSYTTNGGVNLIILLDPELKLFLQKSSSCILASH